MISQITSNAELKKLVVSTGNVLNVTNQLASKTNEELLDSLQKALLNDNTTTKYVTLNKHEARVLHASEELSEKVAEYQRSELGIGAKLFVNDDSPACVEQAVHALLNVLQVQHLDNVVVAYYPRAQNSTNDAATAAADDFKWTGKDSEQCFDKLKGLWTALEELASRKEIFQLGVCDLDAETLTKLHSTAQTPPTIAQINLSSCCVVPKTLQDFCTQHDIQLLTHSDPEILLSADSGVIPGYSVDWTMRYRVHVRGRGVIAAKGYLVGASRQQ